MILVNKLQENRKASMKLIELRFKCIKSLCSFLSLLLLLDTVIENFQIKTHATFIDQKR